MGHQISLHKNSLAMKEPRPAPCASLHALPRRANTRRKERRGPCTSCSLSGRRRSKSRSSGSAAGSARARKRRVDSGQPLECVLNSVSESAMPLKIYPLLLIPWRCSSSLGVVEEAHEAAALHGAPEQYKNGGRGLRMGATNAGFLLSYTDPW